MSYTLQQPNWPKRILSFHQKPTARPPSKTEQLKKLLVEGWETARYGMGTDKALRAIVNWTNEKASLGAMRRELAGHCVGLLFEGLEHRWKKKKFLAEVLKATRYQRRKHRLKK